MSVYAGPNLISDNLEVYLDAGNPQSYPGTGTSWFDLSGNSNTGTLVAGPSYTSSNKGAITFDGVDDIVQVPGDYHLLSTMTICAWFKPANTISSAGNISGRLWGKGQNLEQRWDGGGMPAGACSFDVGGNNSISSVRTTWLNTVWYNLVLVIDTSTTALYIQGKLDATGTRGSITTQTATMLIGKSASNAGSPFEGALSNFIIYNRVLTAAEIKQNFNATRGRYGL